MHRPKSRDRPKSEKEKQFENNVERKQVHQMVTSDDFLDCGEFDISIDDFTRGERQSIMARLNAKPNEVSKRVILTVKADTGANGNI